MYEFLFTLKLVFFFILRYILFAGTALAIFYLVFKKFFKRYKIQNKKADKKDFLRELFYSIQTNLVFVGTALLVEFGPLGEYSKIYANIHEFPLWYLPVSVVLALLIHDTYFYWMHRTIHIEPLYRTLHKTHHLSTNPSPLASFAFHAGESVLESFIIIIVIFLIPIHISMIFVFTSLSLLINVYGHLGFEIMPKWFRKTPLFQIVNTSVHHNMHHQYFKGNYGLYFRFWDRLMGTENVDYVSNYETVIASRDKYFNTDE
ncbi:MAG: lathosterol oxidase [Chitinophagales bacterium]|jgi:lathosterol oxidase